MSRALAKSGLYLALIGVALLLGGGLIAQSILPLYPITASIRVVSDATGQPIIGASVSSYVMGSLIGQGITGVDGIAHLTCNTNIATTFVVVASGYAEKTQVLTLTSTAMATITLTPGTSPNYVTVRIYTVTSEGYMVQGVKIQGGVVEAITNANSYADVLCVDGSVALTLNGAQATVKRSSLWEMMSFGTLTTQIVAEEDAVYTAIVPEGSILLGKPDFPINLWDLLMASSYGVPNWMIALGVFLLLISRR